MHSNNFLPSSAIPFDKELPRFFLTSTCLSLLGIFVRDANACALPAESFRLKVFCCAVRVNKCFRLLVG